MQRLLLACVLGFVCVAPARASTIVFATDDPTVLQFASQGGAVRDANQGTWGPTTNLGSGFSAPENRIDVGLAEVFPGSDSELRSFFSFDLSTLAATLMAANERIIGATFEITGFYSANQSGSNGFEATETLGIFDVSTDPLLLNENVGQSDAIYADLADGAAYGAFALNGFDGNAPAPAPGSDFSVALNALALGDLAPFAAGTATTDYFSLGLALLTADLVGGPDELLQFTETGTSGIPRGRLVLETQLVPEPGSAGLLALGLLGLGGWRRARKEA
jgi:hypothetical protein